MFLKLLRAGNCRLNYICCGLLLLASTSTFGAALGQKNVNAIGPTPINWFLAGNARMQQNEPGCATSSVNPDLLFCAYNDNRAVNRPDIGDTGQGISMSRDGGLSWISGLGPGHLIDTISINQKTTADANVEALPNFLMHNFIGLWRDGTEPSGLYVSRYYERGREVGPPWQHLDIKRVFTVTGGRSIDKPAFETALYDPDLGMPDIVVPIPAFTDPNDSTSGHLAFDLQDIHQAAWRI